MRYTADVFTRFTEVRIIHGEVPFHHNLTLELHSVSVPSMLNYDDKSIQTLMSRAEVINDFDDCVSKVIKTRKTACMGPSFQMNYLIEKYRNPDGSPVVKSLKTPLYRGYRAFVFERTSPYIEKLNTIFQRIIESGIPESGHPSWRYKQKYEKMDHRIDNTGETEDMTLTELIIVLSVGYSISVLVFLMELNANVLKKCKVVAKLRALVAKFQRV